MKTKLVRLAAAIAVLGGTFAQGKLWAQAVSAKVPFAFRAGDTLLPAGSYILETNNTNQTVLIRGTKGGAAMIALTNAAERLKAPADAELVFNRYGDKYFLSQVWNAGYNQGRQFKKSAAEKEMARGGIAEVAILRIHHR